MTEEQLGGVPTRDKKLVAAFLEQESKISEMKKAVDLSYLVALEWLSREGDRTTFPADEWRRISSREVGV